MKVLIVLASICVLLGCGVNCSPLNIDSDYSRENNPSWSTSENLLSKLRRTASSGSSENNVNADVSQWFEAQPFLRKINNRLNESNVLRSMPYVQERIRNLAKDGLKCCKTTDANSLNMSCVGHLTGQIMQRIASVERTNRALPDEKSQNSQERDW